MIAFEVNDMTCGHCVSTLAQALKALDPAARVEIDLATHRVQIEAVEADAGGLSDAIKQAGYTPVAVADAPACATQASSGSCCCH